MQFYSVFNLLRILSNIFLPVLHHNFSTTAYTLHSLWKLISIVMRNCFESLQFSVIFYFNLRGFLFWICVIYDILYVIIEGIFSVSSLITFGVTIMNNPRRHRNRNSLSLQSERQQLNALTALNALTHVYLVFLKVSRPDRENPNRFRIISASFLVHLQDSRRTTNYIKTNKLGHFNFQSEADAIGFWSRIQLKRKCCVSPFFEIKHLRGVHIFDRQCKHGWAGLHTQSTPIFIL